MFVLLLVAGWYACDRLGLFRPRERAGIVRDDYAPSSFVGAGVVEEVVREVHESRGEVQRRGVLMLPYDELPFAEKINYEILFARSLFSILTRAVPRGVGFRELHISAFKTLYAVGLCESKEKVRAFFEGLRREHVDLLPKPYTRISLREGSFQFAVSCNAGFGLDVADPFVDLSLSHIPAHTDLESVVETVVNRARQNGITFSEGPERLGAVMFGGYRRFRYKLGGSTSYLNLVSFVNSLYDSRIPCAFEEIRLTAISEDRVRLAAELVIYTSFD